MKLYVCTVLPTLLFLGFSMAKIQSPNVQVYSRNPGKFSESNTIICHVSNFYPPDIKIDIVRNEVVIPGASQTDLAFENDWHYYLTKHVAFTPEEGDKFACRVIHAGKVNTYVWEPDM